MTAEDDSFNKRLRFKLELSELIVWQENNPGMTHQPLQLITNTDILQPDGHFIRGSVWLTGNTIHDVTEDAPGGLLLKRDDIEVIDGQGCYLTPGLIDQHINGALGADFNHDPISQIHQALAELPHYGITGIVPTVITAPAMDMLTAINTLEEVIHLNRPAQTRFLGIHLEGPCLNPKYRGTHPKESLLPIRQDMLETLSTLLSPHTKMVTLAPELDPDGLWIQPLLRRGIKVLAGHSDATLSEMARGIQLGITGATHLYNTMRPLHHREPGLVVAALNDPGITIELIADGHHIHPEMIRLSLLAKMTVDARQAVLVSDAMQLAGLAPASSQATNGVRFAGQTVHLADGKAVNEEGNLAGSATLLDDCVRNLVRWNILDFGQAVIMATLNPARYLGVDQRLGMIHPGYEADLTLWRKDDLSIQATWLQGKQVYQANSLGSAGNTAKSKSQQAQALNHP